MKGWREMPKSRRWFQLTNKGFDEDDDYSLIRREKRRVGASGVEESTLKREMEAARGIVKRQQLLLLLLDEFTNVA